MKEEKHTGTVDWFDAQLGYGFISRPGESDIFVHFSAIECEGYKTLKNGQSVVFSIGLNHRQQPIAVEVSVIPES